jgi:hypothetical protein
VQQLGIVGSCDRRRNHEYREVVAMALSTIDRLLAQLHGVIGEARLVPIQDPRWGVYWTEAKRLADRIDTSVSDKEPARTDN